MSLKNGQFSKKMFLTFNFLAITRQGARLILSFELMVMTFFYSNFVIIQSEL